MPKKKGTLVRNITKGTARHKAWQSMRIMRKFSVADIVKTSGAGFDNVQKFVSLLARHGYVREIPGYRGGRPGTYKQYVLIKNPGPDHPLVCDICGKSILKTLECKPPEVDNDTD